MSILRPYFGYLWVVGVFLPQTFFIPFTSILISGGAMSEEYEQGTAELLLSKPVTKADYFAGKFLGGYLLIVFLIALNMLLSVVSASITFGPQSRALHPTSRIRCGDLQCPSFLWGGLHVWRSRAKILLSIHHLFSAFFYKRNLWDRPNFDLYPDQQSVLPTDPDFPPDLAYHFAGTSSGDAISASTGERAPYIRLLRGRGGDFHSFHHCLDSSVLSLGLRNLFCLL